MSRPCCFSSLVWVRPLLLAGRGCGCGATAAAEAAEASLDASSSTRATGGVGVNAPAGEEVPGVLGGAVRLGLAHVHAAPEGASGEGEGCQDYADDGQ